MFGIDYSVFSNLRSSAGQGLTQKAFVKLLDNNDPMLECKLRSYMGNIAGSKVSWNLNECFRSKR
jgi:hypothetical protein